MNESAFKVLATTSVRRKDDRGHLDVIYEQGEVVLKRSFSKAGVFRGMHWQSPPNEQIKIIRVLSGQIIDFIADMSTSPLEIHQRLIESSDGWIMIDAKYAHGFYAIKDTNFEYICIGAYNEKSEKNFSIFDILKNYVGIEKLIISEKDLHSEAIDNLILKTIK